MQYQEQQEHLTFRMHYNKTTHAFSIRRSSDRSVVRWLHKVPLIGTVHTLAPNVHILATRKDYLKAQQADSRPVLTVAVTQFPKLRLFFMSLKEAL